MVNVAFGADAFPSLTVNENLYEVTPVSKSRDSINEILPAGKKNNEDNRNVIVYRRSYIYLYIYREKFCERSAVLFLKV